MDKKYVPFLIFIIITFGAALFFIIYGIVNWGKLCGLEFISIIIGAVIMLCPCSCFCYSLWLYDKSIEESKEKQMDIKEPLTKEEIAELEKIEMEV